MFVISLIFVSLFVIFALPVTLVISTWSITPVISIWSARVVITFISVHYSFWFTTTPVIVTLRWLTPGALYLSIHCNGTYARYITSQFCKISK